MPRGIPGPVVVKKTKKKSGEPKDPDNPQQFEKGGPGGPGRPRGVPNKFTKNLKEEILAGINGAHERGVAGFVLDLAIDTPTSAAALLGRFIPLQTESKVDLKHEVRITFDDGSGEEERG